MQKGKNIKEGKKQEKMGIGKKGKKQKMLEIE